MDLLCHKQFMTHLSDPILFDLILQKVTNSRTVSTRDCEVGGRLISAVTAH